MVVAADVAPAHPAASSFGPARVLLTHLAAPSVYAIGGALYVSNESPSGASSLTRLNPATGAIGARLTFRRVNIDAVLLGEGWLWATITPLDRGRPSWLLRLEPDTLHVLSRTRLTSASPDDLAVAGSSVWVGDGGAIDDVATIGPTIIRRVPIRGAKQVSLESGEHGRLLLISEGDFSGHARIERRDPYTGALDATSSPFLGATLPRLGGTAGVGLWLTESTGMQGYVEQLDVEVLKPLHPHVPVFDTNGVRAQVIDGILWISQPDGGPSRNYCADPVGGRARVVIPSAAQRG